MTLTVCPSTLQKGYNTFSPTALKRLFDGQSVSPILPYKNLDDAGIQQQFNESRNFLSLSGAQSKYPAVVDNGIIRPTHDGEQGTHLLKPCLNGFAYAQYSPANEHLTMQIAEQAYGIPTAASAVCFFQNGTQLYLTRRYDIDGNGQRIQQEDFASLAGITADTNGADFKYDALSYEEIAQIIKKHLGSWSVDLLRYYDLILFNFLFCNADAHIKNFSALRRPDGDYGLAPAYDLLNTKIHIQNNTEFALTKGLFSGDNQHKEWNLNTAKTFLDFGLQIGLSKRAVEREWKRFSADNEKVHTLIDNSFLSDTLKEMYLHDYENRRNHLSRIMGV